MKIDPVSANRIMAKAAHVVQVWAPWWSVYLGNVDYVYSEGQVKSIIGLSSLVFRVDTDFIMKSSVMEVAIALEFALQQALRKLDDRSEQMRLDYPQVDDTLIALAGTLEITSDIESTFEGITQARWNAMVHRSVDNSFVPHFDLGSPPDISGFRKPEEFGFEPKLRAENYLRLLINAEEEREREWIEDQEHVAPKEPDEGIEEESQGDSEPEGDASEETQGASGSGESDPDGINDTENASGDAGDAGDAGDDAGDEAGDAGDASGNSPGDAGDAGDDAGDAGDDAGDKAGDAGDASGDSPGDAVSGRASDEAGGTNETDGDLPDGEPSPSGSSDEKEDSGLNSTGATPDSDSELPADKADASGEALETNSEATGVEDVSEGLEEPTGGVDGSKDHRSDELAASDDQEVPAEKSDSDGTSESSSSDIEEVEADSSDGESNAPSQRENDSSGQGSSEDEGDQWLDSLSHMESGTAKRYVSLAEDIRRSTEDLSQLQVAERGEETLVGKNVEEMEDLTKELAEAIVSAPSLPGAPSASDEITEWARSRLKKSVISWRKVLPRMLNVLVSRAQMSGMTDLSYAKQNPNQMDDTPIMMGFITYPPEVTILIDASPSMRPYVDSVMSDFVSVMKKFFLIYSQPVTIAVADGKIRWATQSVTPYGSVLSHASRTHHGTSYDFGDTLKRTITKGAMASKRSFPKPDVLVVFTDCEFQFPWPDRTSLPRSAGKVIIVSSSPYERVKSILPPWVKEGRNFLYAETS